MKLVTLARLLLAFAAGACAQAGTAAEKPKAWALVSAIGVGLYIQPIGRGPSFSLENDIHTAINPDTVSPTGEMNPSYRFMAPYFYAQVFVIDAKTMKVLETHERYDFQRLYDPDSPALDVAQTIPVEVLAPMMEEFVQRAAARALHDRESEVTVKEPRILDPAPRK